MVVVYPKLDLESGDMVHIHLDSQGLMDIKEETKEMLQGAIDHVLQSNLLWQIFRDVSDAGARIVIKSRGIAMRSRS